LRVYCRKGGKLGGWKAAEILDRIYPPSSALQRGNQKTERIKKAESSHLKA
jgi:hypothetical protein